MCQFAAHPDGERRRIPDGSGRRSRQVDRRIEQRVES
jgi:hypothetical protein